MEEMARNMIKHHKNPLTKVGLIGPKLFFKDSSLEAYEFVSKNLESLENVLRHGKVDKRCARAKAEWDSSLNLAKVNKVVKGLLENFGYQDKSGIYMYAEEMLYLVETNRMEVSISDVPLSIQECYDIVCNIPEMNLKKYQVYKKLVLKGYKVVRYSEIMRKRKKLSLKNDNNSEQPVQTKRLLEDLEDSTECKKVCLEEGNANKLERTKKYIEGIFDKLRENAPRPYIPEETEESKPDFCVFSSSNPNRIDWDFNVHICETYAVDLLKSNSTKPSIYAICSGDNTSFYKLGAVYLPEIWLE